MKAAEFLLLLQANGEPVSFRSPGAVAGRNLKAVVGSMNRASIEMVNQYGLSARSFQFAARDFAASPPKTYDVVTTGDGGKFTLKGVVPKHEEGTGTLVSFTCYGDGK